MTLSNNDINKKFIVSYRGEERLVWMISLHSSGTAFFQFCDGPTRKGFAKQADKLGRFEDVLRAAD